LILKKITSIFYLGFLFLLFVSCSSKFLKTSNEKVIQDHKEFEEKIQIEEYKESSKTTVAADESSNKSSSLEEKSKNKELELNEAKAKQIQKTKAKKMPSKVKKSEKQSEVNSVALETKPLRRQPELEDDKGFNGRRPIIDPFIVGEKVKHEVTYLNMTGGYLTFENEPFQMVNGRKSYKYTINLKTAPFFSKIYAVDDTVSTLVDYESLLPTAFFVHLKESKQLKESRMLFDWEHLKAMYWEKKITEEKGTEENKKEWDILPYSQNVFSVLFYLRNFQLDVNNEYNFRVADDGHNKIFKAKVLRKEKIKTKAGEFNAVVVSPEVKLKEQLQQTGEIFLWISDDDRRYILRIECKIKIGSLTSEVISIND